MLIRIHTVQPSILLPVPVLLEVNISRGIKFHISGNVHSSIKENRQRIYATLKNEGWHWPGQRITLNFRPLELLKKGSHYDLPMAVGILGASSQISTELMDQSLFYGAIQLDGTIEPAIAPFKLLQTAFHSGHKRVILNVPSNSLTRLSAEFHTLEIVNVSRFSEVVAFLQKGIRPAQKDTSNLQMEEQEHGCFSEVKGLQSFKRALEIAASGGHHVLLNGAPGIGKTMLLARFPSILPPMNMSDRRVFTMINEDGGSTFGGRRPTINTVPEESVKSLFGSREVQSLKEKFELGEVELWNSEFRAVSKGVLGKFHRALGGVLFLDELPTFSKSVLDALLLHMDRHRVQMIMAMNPCHCGYFNHPELECTCSAASFHRYQGMLSGALLDRIDLQLMHTPSAPKVESETSVTIQQRVEQAYNRQIDRSAVQNARLTLDELKPIVLHNNVMKRHFLNYYKSAKWSLRKQRSILSVTLTIADLEHIHPTKKHLDEAVALSAFSTKVSKDELKRTTYKRPTVVLGPNIKV